MTNKTYRNISLPMFEYKETIRHIWNQSLASNASVETFRNFRDVETALFNALVVSPLNLNVDASSFREKHIEEILVSIKSHCVEFPVSIGMTQKNGNIVWSAKELLPVHRDQKLYFFDFFDWNHYGFVDYPYVRCYVGILPQNPSFEGKICMLENRLVEFLAE